GTCCTSRRSCSRPRRSRWWRGPTARSSSTSCGTCRSTGTGGSSRCPCSGSSSALSWPCSPFRSFLQFAGDRRDVLLEPRIRDVVALVLVVDLPRRGNLVGRLARFDAGLHVGEEVLVELRVFGEGRPRHDRAVAGDHRV